MRDVPVGIDMTIEQATDIWLSGYASANTRAAYSSDLRAFLSWFGDLADAMGATTDNQPGHCRSPVRGTARRYLRPPGPDDHHPDHQHILKGAE